MYHDITDIRVLDDYTLRLTFDDGKSGVLDCKLFIDKGGVFSKLRDPEFFKTIHIRLGDDGLTIAGTYPFMDLSAGLGIMPDMDDCMPFPPKMIEERCGIFHGQAGFDKFPFTAREIKVLEVDQQ